MIRRVLISAPENVTLMRASSESLMFSIMPAPQSPGVTFYSVITDGNSTNSSCVVNATEVVMQCELDGLTPNTEYLVFASACMTAGDSHVCSDEISLLAWTVSPGKLSTLPTALCYV